MSHIITDLKEVTPAWLTDVLTRNRHLKSGDVNHLDITATGETGTGSHAYLTVDYSPNTSVMAPQRLFIKYTKVRQVEDRDRTETSFYQATQQETNLPVIAYDQIFAHVDGGRSRCPVVPCYEVKFCQDTGRAHLLLADMSETHIDWGDIPQPTPINYLKSAVACLARLHAAWWEYPRLGKDILGKDIGEHVESEPIDPRSSENQKRFEEVARKRLDVSRLSVYDQMVKDETWSKLETIFQPDAPLTLVHSDVIANILYPRDLKKDEPVLIDWQCVDAAPGATDVAFFLIESMAPPHSNSVEPTLLTHYYEQLQWHGVSEYSWEAFFSDYRRAVTNHLTSALFAWHDWRSIERAFAKFESLKCVDLLY